MYSVYPEIWYQYGSYCIETGDYDTAIASLNKTAELYKNSVMYDDKPGLRNNALVTIGEVHLLHHDFISAKDQFEKCLSLKNDRDMIIAIAATYIYALDLLQNVKLILLKKGLIWLNYAKKEDLTLVIACQ